MQQGTECYLLLAERNAVSTTAFTCLLVLSDRCYLPRSVGRCHGTSYRYYYNYETGSCEEFVYGGCLGNDNKFDTLDECIKVCVKPHDPGMSLTSTTK